MTGTSPRRTPKNSRSGSDPLNRASFSNELTAYLMKKMTDSPKQAGLKYKDFVAGLTDAILRSSKAAPDGMRLAILQTLIFELTDRLDEMVDIPEQPTSDTAFDSQDAMDKDALKTTATELNEYTKGTASIKTWEDTASFCSESVLHKNGYSAAEGGLSPIERRGVLTRIFVDQRPLGVTTKIEKEQWGSASSPQRLYAMSKFIAWLVRFQGRDKPAARKKWIDDLAWLKERSYEPEMGFEWPVLESSSTTVQRSATRPINAAFMQPLTPSPELAAVVGTAALPRTEMVKKLWVYIKKNNLQDSVNKRMINSDSKLMEIFGKPQVSMFEMAGLIGKHLR